MQEHIHTSQIVGSMVNLLPEEAFFYQMLIKMFLCLQKQRARPTRRVIDFINGSLPVHRQLCYKFGNMLRREKLPSRLTCIGSVVRNQKLIRIPKEVYMAFLKTAKI